MNVIFHKECNNEGTVIDKTAEIVVNADRVHFYRGFFDLINGDQIETLQFSFTNGAVEYRGRYWADISIAND